MKRHITLMVAAAMLAGFQEAPAEREPEPEDKLAEDSDLANHPELDLPSPADCSDTIQLVRSERGLPLLDRRPANPDEPILFRAVDYHIDGCDVLLMPTGEVRDLPKPQDGPLLQRAQ